MYQTLNDLEYVLSQPKRKHLKFSKFFKELKILWFIFSILFLGAYLVTNAQLVIDNFTDRFSTNNVNDIHEEFASSSYIWNHQTAREKTKEVEDMVKDYEGVISLQQDVATDMNHYLQHNLDSYEFSFNLLPPTKRLIISSINLDVPLIETNIKNYDDFDESTFDSELENWVVKYPTTPNPWEWWNAFFFWHTSQEYWKNNPYWTVFRNIPKLKANDKIQVVRNWVLYEYKVVKTVVVKPKNVNDTYVQFWDENKEYITLMWCYPIWRTDKRMMVFAERI